MCAAGCMGRVGKAEPPAEKRHLLLFAVPANAPIDARSGSILICNYTGEEVV